MKLHLGTLNAILILFCEPRWECKCAIFKTGIAVVISEIAGLANYKDQRKFSGEAEWQLRAAGRREERKKKAKMKLAIKE